MSVTLDNKLGQQLAHAQTFDRGVRKTYIHTNFI